ncbi:MAG: hypothetical protein ACMUIA_01905 [bacterium]
MGVWTFFDARSRGKEIFEAWLWASGTFLILGIVLPVWLFTRPPLLDSSSSHHKAGDRPPHSEQHEFLCTNCQRSIEGLNNPRFCPYCGQPLTSNSAPIITINSDHRE